MKSYFLTSVWIFIGPNVSVVPVENSIVSESCFLRKQNMQFKKFIHNIAVTTIRSKLHDVENQRAPKLALFERGMDLRLALLMYDALQTVKLQLQLQFGEC